MKALLGQPSDAEGPVFREAWEAQAFALAILLHKSGVFAWKEWTSLLSEEIEDAQASGELEPGSSYYHHWLKALERVVVLKGIASFGAIKDLAQAWEEAAHHTPHGKPIVPPSYRDQTLTSLLSPDRQKF
jgi:nitrile hydratase accessory protein